MILRALFWIAIVGVLMPREPDLGLGRPGAITSLLPAAAASWVKTTTGAPEAVCTAHADGCAETLTVIDTLQNAAVRSLAQVKEEIEASKRERQAQLQAQRLASND